MRWPSYNPSYITASVGLGLHDCKCADMCITTYDDVHCYTMPSYYSYMLLSAIKKTNSAICADSPVSSRFGVNYRTDHQKRCNLQVNVRYTDYPSVRSIGGGF